jgi:hypothetical protein
VWGRCAADPSRVAAVMFLSTYMSSSSAQRYAARGFIGAPRGLGWFIRPAATRHGSVLCRWLAATCMSDGCWCQYRFEKQHALNICEAACTLGLLLTAPVNSHDSLGANCTAMLSICFAGLLLWGCFARGRPKLA